MANPSVGKWTEIFLVSPYSRLLKTYGPYPVKSPNGRQYPITPQPFAIGIVDYLTRVVRDWTDATKHENYDAAQTHEALGRAGMATGLVEDAHQYISPDGTADIGTIPPGYWKNRPGIDLHGYGAPSWTVLNPDGAQAFWDAIRDLTGYLDDVGPRDYSFWESMKAGLAYTFDGLGDTAVALVDAAKKIPEAVTKAANAFGWIIDIATSPITWAVVGGGLIIHYMGEETKKPKRT